MSVAFYQGRLFRFIFSTIAVVGLCTATVYKNTAFSQVRPQNKLPSTASAMPRHAIPLTLPLHYAAYGTYTVPLNVGNQTINVVVDTGSSNLNLIGDPTICDHCSSLGIPNSKLTPDAKQKATPNYFMMQYGSGQGILRQYQGTVGFANLPQIPYVYSVFISNPGAPSLLGMAYQTLAAPEGFPPPSFIGQWLAAGHYKKRFTLTLCGAKGNSTLVVGGIPKGIDKAKIEFTPVVRKEYYSVLMRGIVDKKTKQWIVNFGAPYVNQEAIVDSGTTGAIFLPQNAVSNLIVALQKSVGKAVTAKLSPGFWRGGCTTMPSSMLSQFPTLQVVLLKWGHPQQSIFVDLPPEQYFSSVNCLKGQRMLAFVSTGSTEYPSPFIVNRLRSVGKVTLKILGTPFLQGKSVIFDRGWNYNVTRHYDAKIGFIDAGAPCV